MLVSHVDQLSTDDGAAPRTVIVGAGAMGLYAARELSRRGRPVVLIESGSEDLSGFAAESFSTAGRRHDGIRIGRGRMLGGTTNLWGGQLVEFQPIDFAPREGIPGSEWPVPYDEIRPYYQRTYENLGFEEGFPDDERVLTHFLGPRHELQEGLELFLTRWLRVPSFAVFYGGAIRTSPHLRVLLNHTAVGFRGAQGRIEAVEARAPDGGRVVVPGDRFILAAGTVEISRLLLHAARSTTWECPWRENSSVGAYFQDHIGGTLAAVRAADRRRLFDVFCTMHWLGHKYQPKTRLANHAREESKHLSIHGWLGFDSSVSENLVYLKQFLKAAIYSRRISDVRGFVQNLRACGQYLVPLMWKYAVDHRVFVPSNSRISLVAQCEQVPLRESRITIDPARTDSNGLPAAVLDWRVGGEELASMRDFARRFDRALRTTGWGSLEIPGDLEGLEPRFLDTLRDTNHQSGGARMGFSEHDGVVDRNLKVFGTRNLYVAGSATFRTSSGANSTFTALAFVTRLLDHLDDHRADG